MQYSYWLDNLSLWGFLGITVTLIALGMESGFRLGAWRRTHLRVEKEGPAGAVVGATLGLLAFMLAITFGIAMSRFDSRRAIFLAEVDAIGTAYIRADFLPPLQKELVKGHLREYVEVRLKAVESRDFATGIRRSEELHKELWSQVTAADTIGSHNQALLSLFVVSVNEVMDLHTKRVTAGLRSRIPPIIWLVLYLVAALGVGSIGYQTALAGSARSFTSVALIVSLASVLWLVADLDQPFQGALRVSQQPLKELQRTMMTPIASDKSP